MDKNGVYVTQSSSNVSKEMTIKQWIWGYTERHVGKACQNLERDVFVCAQTPRRAFQIKKPACKSHLK